MRNTVGARRWLAVLPVAALAAGCGQAVDHPADQPAESRPGGALVVTTAMQPGDGGGLYIEGAVRVMTLETPDGDTRKIGPGDRDRTVFRVADLAPGTYTLHAAVRPCDGNCGTLDEPTDGCTKVIRVERQRVVLHVDFRVGHSCRFSEPSTPSPV